MSPRDNQRSKLYCAESAVASKGRQLSSVDDIQGYVDSVTESQWWQNRSAITRVYIRDGRGRRSAGAWANRNRALGYITMPRRLRRELYILHELAHIMTLERYASHGCEFASNYLALVTRWMGRAIAVHLRNSFRQHRVKWYRQNKQP